MPSAPGWHNLYTSHPPRSTPQRSERISRRRENPPPPPPPLPSAAPSAAPTPHAPPFILSLYSF
eukprot:764572-Hanusia_phi.AAC.1